MNIVLLFNVWVGGADRLCSINTIVSFCTPCVCGWGEITFCHLQDVWVVGGAHAK